MKDLREFIEKVDGMCELKVIKGADWNLEIGAITALSRQDKKQAPAIIFDEIKGYPKGFRVLVNASRSPSRMALTLNLPTNLKRVEILRELKERWPKLKPIPPKVIKDGPVMENIQRGKDIDVLKFPAPKYHEFDGGRYIGTGSVTITQDPDNGWINLGTYRVMIHNRNTLSFFASPGKHGRVHREILHARGKPCKVAISVGHSPQLLIGAGNPSPAGFSEYDFVGGLRGEPVEVIKGPYTGLPIPAYSEIVIEGESLPDETMVEGPFGEWTGYYASGARTEPVIRIKSIMHRNNPIILGESPQRPGPDFTNLIRCAELWQDLENAGVSEVKGVWMYYGSYIIVVSIKQLHGGHDKQAALAACSSRVGAYHGRYVIVVDEDIDPSDLDSVLWAVCTRCDPAKTVDIVHRAWSTPLDPLLRKGEAPINSRAILCACKPFEWINEFPKAIEVSPQQKERFEKKWKRMLD